MYFFSCKITYLLLFTLCKLESYINCYKLDFIEPVITGEDKKINDTDNLNSSTVPGNPKNYDLYKTDKMYITIMMPKKGVKFTTHVVSERTVVPSLHPEMDIKKYSGYMSLVNKQGSPAYKEHYESAHTYVKYVLPAYKCNEIMTSEHYNPRLPIVTIIPGKSEDNNRTSVRSLAEGYLKRSSDIIVVVEWRKLNKSFYASIKNSISVSRNLAVCLNQLLAGDSLKPIHIVAFSLGAHMAGFTSQFMTRKVNKITGLDPMNWGNFIMWSKEVTLLDKTKANFVQVFQSDMGGLGIKAPIGHVNVIINKGTRFQPGCDDRYTIHRWSPRRLWSMIRSTCSHAMSYKLYVETITTPNPGNLVARKCESYDRYIRGYCSYPHIPIITIGHNLDGITTPEGTYYIETNRLGDPTLGKGIIGATPRRLQFSQVDTTAISRGEFRPTLNQNIHKMHERVGLRILLD